MRLIYFSCLFFVLSSCKNNQNIQPPILDTNSTVTIFSQKWMKYNLNLVTFKNGDSIPEAKTDKEWNEAYKNKKPAWCFRNNDKNNESKYGRLYNWFAVNDIRGIVPSGWHIPTQAEWITLYNNIGGQSTAGGKLKSQSGWYNNGNGSDEFGFRGLPGGRRIDEGLFQSPNYESFWWTSSEGIFPEFNAWATSIYYISNDLNIFEDSKGSGLSIRCIKD